MRSLQYRTLTLALLLVLGAAAAAAQPMRMNPEERTEQLATSLSLTPEQKPKVLEIFKAADEARRKAFEEREGDRDAMRQVMQKQREETDAKLKAVLTEEQFAQYEKLRTERRRSRPGNR